MKLNPGDLISVRQQRLRPGRWKRSGFDTKWVIVDHTMLVTASRRSTAEHVGVVTGLIDSGEVIEMVFNDDAHFESNVTILSRSNTLTTGAP